MNDRGDRMTPEEKAVIDAAIAWSRSETIGAAGEVLYDAVVALPATISVWQPATLLYCLSGDHIRMGTDEADVLRCSSGAWHANVASIMLPSGKVWDKITPWKHTELWMSLSVDPTFQPYPPNAPCEILCTPERLAVLTLMRAFPGSTEVKS